jgi:hypothetical protein
MEGREEEGRDLNYLCVWFKMKSGGEGRDFDYILCLV